MHHLTLLLPFLPLMLDPTSCLLSVQKSTALIAGCQVEVTNGLKCVYCVDFVRWCISYKIWQLDSLGIKYGFEYSYDITRLGPYKLREFPGRNNKTGRGGRWMLNTGDSWEKQECWWVWCSAPDLSRSPCVCMRASDVCWLVCIN